MTEARRRRWRLGRLRDRGGLTLVERPAGAERRNGPDLKKAESLIDPLGTPYFYRHRGDHGEDDLYSLGKDGREGGEGDAADITNW